LNDELNKKQAGQEVLVWFQSLKTTGGFGPVSKEILDNGRRTFESDRVDDQQTLETIRSCYEQIGEVLDPHSAIGVAAAKRSIGRSGSHIPHISLATAHPAKFSEAVNLALKHENGFDFEKRVLPPELLGLAQMEKRVTTVENSWETVREIVKKQVAEDMR
jgi:threonine synthase